MKYLICGKHEEDMEPQIFGVFYRVKPCTQQKCLESLLDSKNFTS